MHFSRYVLVVIALVISIGRIIAVYESLAALHKGWRIGTVASGVAVILVAGTFLLGPVVTRW